MRKILWSVLLASPLAFVGLGLTNSSVVAQTVQNNNENQVLEQLNQYSLEGNKQDSLNQVTNVSELRDVSPGDWAYEALRSLVERYGCIAGYPNGTFRGNKAMTRYEFAAGLNACLNQLERILGGGNNDDIEKLTRLTEEFKAELATLGTRVDKLEERVGFLEDHQFSTTTKLQGEVVFSVSDVLSDLQDDSKNENTVFQDRVRLNLVSSFTGKDSLNTRLSASNAKLREGLDQGTLTYQTNGKTDNSVEIDWIGYYTPLGDKGQLYVAYNPLFVDFVPSVSPYLDSFGGATGSLSSFAESSPIYKILNGNAGAGINYNLTDNFMISAGYIGGGDKGAQNPQDKAGLFNGGYSALGQLTWTPSDDFQLAATYVRSYFPTGSSSLFDLGVGTSTVNNFIGAAATEANSYGLEASFKLSPSFVINAYGGYTSANRITGNKADAEIWYYGAGLALPDFGKEGNLLGVVVGAEPYVGGQFVGKNLVNNGDDDIALHVEGFYKYQVNDNLSITPGVIWIRSPFGQTKSGNDDQSALIGVVRTTFTF